MLLGSTVVSLVPIFRLLCPLPQTQPSLRMESISEPPVFLRPFLCIKQHIRYFQRKPLRLSGAKGEPRKGPSILQRDSFQMWHLRSAGEHSSQMLVWHIQPAPRCPSFPVHLGGGVYSYPPATELCLMSNRYTVQSNPSSQYASACRVLYFPYHPNPSPTPCE